MHDCERLRRLAEASASQDRRQNPDQGRAGREPSGLRGDGGDRGRHPRHLGIWAGDGGEGAQYWLHVFTKLKNRGLDDVLMLVCDGFKGLPEAVETVWPRTIIQTCVVHLLRNSFRYAARQDWDKVAGALKPVYTAPSEDAATERFLEFQEYWGTKYPAIVKLWSDAWAEFVPFLSFDVEIRKVICSTNAIESVNARIRKAVRARLLPQRGRRPQVHLHGADEPGPDGERAARGGPCAGRHP